MAILHETDLEGYRACVEAARDVADVCAVFSIAADQVEEALGPARKMRKMAHIFSKLVHQENFEKFQAYAQLFFLPSNQGEIDALNERAAGLVMGEGKGRGRLRGIFMGRVRMPPKFDIKPPAGGCVAWVAGFGDYKRSVCW